MAQREKMKICYLKREFQISSYNLQQKFWILRFMKQIVISSRSHDLRHLCQIDRHKAQQEIIGIVRAEQDFHMVSHIMFDISEIVQQSWPSFSYPESSCPVWSLEVSKLVQNKYENNRLENLKNGELYYRRRSNVSYSNVLLVQKKASYCVHKKHLTGRP